MTPDQDAIRAPDLAPIHPGPCVSRRLRGAISWVVFLGVTAGIAHLFQSRVTRASAGAAAPAAQSGAPNQPPPWRAKLDAITKTEAAPAEICRQLRDLWQSLPEDGQTDAFRRMVNLLPDGEYGMVREMAATAKLPAASWETLATDALTRPNPVKLPVLLEILAHAGEPARSEAREELVRQLGGDYGEDWVRWKQAVTGKLAQSQ